MIYNENYKVKFYCDNQTGYSPVNEYLNSLDLKIRAKIYKYIEFLRSHDGYLDEPYSKHIQDKIRELRVDFANGRYRLLYFSFVNKNIIFLHIFLKKTAKTPNREIKIARQRYNEVINNPKIYES